MSQNKAEAEKAAAEESARKEAEEKRKAEEENARKTREAEEARAAEEKRAAEAKGAARKEAPQGASLKDLMRAPAQPEFERVTLHRVYTYAGVLYGPGETEIPKGMADNLRRQNRLSRENVEAASVLGSDVTNPRHGQFMDPNQDFGRELLAASFPHREKLIDSGVETRSELSRMSDVDLLQLGFSREAVAAIRDALRVGAHQERGPQTNAVTSR
jgi:hypothetical protein